MVNKIAQRAYETLEGTYPVTPAGKIIGTGVAVLGIAVYAIPAGITSSAFTEELRKKRQKPKTCPHCGKEIK